MPIEQALQKLTEVRDTIKARVDAAQAEVTAAEAARAAAIIKLVAHQVDLATAQSALDQVNS